MRCPTCKGEVEFDEEIELWHCDECLQDLPEFVCIIGDVQAHESVAKGDDNAK